MYIRIVKVPSSSGKVNEYVRIVESYRQDGKVKQRVIADLGRKDVLASLLPRLQRVLGGQEQNVGTGGGLRAGRFRPDAGGAELGPDAGGWQAG